MAKNEIGEYDETDSGNTDISGIGLSDATLIDQLDNIARAQMGALKRWFKSSLFRLRDSTDQTKLLAFDLSGLTTATTRTQIAPDENGRQALQPHLAGHLYGLTLSNNSTDATNDIDIAVGNAIDSTNSHVMTLASALTKRLDAAWAVGTGNGGLDTGAIADTTYHVYLIKRPDTGVVDAIFSTSGTTPTLPANYTIYRRIGSIIRKSAAILAFGQIGDEFIWRTIQTDHVAASLGTSATDFQLTVPSGIAAGVVAKISTYFFKSASAPVGVIYSPSHFTPTPTIGLNNLGSGTSTIDGAAVVEHKISTSSAGQVKAIASAASCTIHITTYGYTDTRGRLS